MTPERANGRPNAADGVAGPDAAAAMTRERWEEIEDLLLAALEVPVAERGGFLSRRCVGDDALRREVESLLAAHAAPGPADRLADTLGARLIAEFIEGGGLEGEVVGRYEIGERLGRGGMSVVYRAWDPKLERHVALKLLPGLVSSDESSRRRLLAEAQMAAGLEHPNICTIHEIGEAEDGRLFIAMPLYDGETLRTRLQSGPLSVEEAVRLALHAARGLARAHDRGVIHRDIKPGNLMITREGTLKILDFGIAQPEGTEDPGGGRTAGTAHYMSPEQVAGGSVDGRADLWSLGVVLYEMLTGRRPFEGETREAVRDAIVHEEPAPLATVLPHISPGLEALIHGLLQKDPSRRPGSAAEVADALRHAERQGRFLRAGPPAAGAEPRDGTALPAPPESAVQRAGGPTTPRRGRPRRRVVGAVIAILAGVALALAAGPFLGPTGPAADGEIRRIAVLPLANLTDDPEQDYFAAAVTDQLIAQFAQIGDLRVAPHSAVLPYRDQPAPVRTIAEDLGVDAVVEGSVVVSGTDVRITARLIDGETEEHLWARDYTRGLRDLPALEKEVAREIAGEVAITLSPQEEARLRTARSVSPAAQAAFLRGVHLQRRYQEGGGTDTTLQRSIRALSRAVELEPNWAEAHAELARAYHWLASRPFNPDAAEYYGRAKEAATKAIQLDETVAGGHAALAFVLYAHDWDWEGAEREFRRALELAPNDNYYRWGLGLFELTAARYEDAVADLRRALEHAPLSGYLHAQFAGALACAGRYGELRTITEMYGEDDIGVLVLLGNVARRQGEEDRGLALLERAVERSDSGTSELTSLAHAYASVGRAQDARALVPELEARGAWIPAVYAALGEPQRAIDELERGIRERHPAVTLIRCLGSAAYADLTKLDVLAGEPRMQEFLRRLNLPD